MRIINEHNFMMVVFDKFLFFLRLSKRNENFSMYRLRNCQ